jgi:hypothetical protein
VKEKGLLAGLKMNQEDLESVRDFVCGWFLQKTSHIQNPLQIHSL